MRQPNLDNNPEGKKQQWKSGKLTGRKKHLRTLIWKTLPKQAKENGGYPIYLNHCFARVVYDNICGGVWYGKLQAPVIPNLSEEQVELGIRIAHDMVNLGKERVVEYNKKSLEWRKHV